MKLEQILVATDVTELSGQAYRTALDLAARAGCEVTVMHTVAGRCVPVGACHDASAQESAALEQWAAATGESLTPVRTHVGFGHPSIEIPRYAEALSAAIIVLGRKPRTQASRFRHGDTADEIMRRSRIPCLLVPPDAGPIRTILAAVDGTLRGGRVLREAGDLARSIGATLHAVTVEPELSPAPSRLASPPLAATVGLRSELGERLSMRSGPIFEQLLAEAREVQPDLLAIGVRRGGSPATLELGSIGRHLAHAAPCAVLTIPL